MDQWDDRKILPPGVWCVTLCRVRFWRREVRYRPSPSSSIPGQRGRSAEAPAPEPPGREDLGEESEDDQPIEGQRALNKLRWLSRIQQARVRKALALERSMGGLLLPQTDKEIKLLIVLLEKEWKLAKALGGLQATAPRRGRMEEGARVDLGVDPAAALRVVTTVRRSLRLVRESESSPESPPPTDGPSAPASRGEGSREGETG